MKTEDYQKFSYVGLLAFHSIGCPVPKEVLEVLPEKDFAKAFDGIPKFLSKHSEPRMSDEMLRRVHLAIAQWNVAMKANFMRSEFPYRMYLMKMDPDSVIGIEKGAYSVNKPKNIFNWFKSFPNEIKVPALSSMSLGKAKDFADSAQEALQQGFAWNRSRYGSLFWYRVYMHLKLGESQGWKMPALPKEPEDDIMNGLKHIAQIRAEEIADRFLELKRDKLDIATDKELLLELGSLIGMVDAMHHFGGLPDPDVESYMYFVRRLLHGKDAVNGKV